ncbi:MAG TPA: hypothetical protein VK789_25795 [Bryobacteraceae bacterium]|nr:hypothetical protein [Bryobacteraceae bacterium]
MNPEHELREALRREPAPEGFAARVLAQTRIPPIRVTPWWRRPATLALAAALLLTLMIPSEISNYRRREQQHGLEAKKQLMNALAITRVQLQQAQARVRRNTRHAL